MLVKKDGGGGVVDVFRTQSNIYDRVFYENSKRKTVTCFRKTFIVDVWLGSKYVSGGQS